MICDVGTMAVVLLLFFIVSLTAAWNFNQMIGKGQWMVMQVFKCPNAEDYELQHEITRKKVNRTHDGFNLYINFTKSIGDDYGIRIEACKYMDGGCKAHQVFADDHACSFLEKYGGQNSRDIFSLSGMDPPKCPVPAGIFSAENYVFDYTQLPAYGIYGTFDATTYILEPKTAGGALKAIGCLKITLRFDNDDDRD